MNNYAALATLKWSQAKEGTATYLYENNGFNLYKNGKQIVLSMAGSEILNETFCAYFQNLMDEGEDNLIFRHEIDNLRNDLSDYEIDELVEKYSDGVRELIKSRQVKKQ